MASLERKREDKPDLFALALGGQRKTSAEMVSEARQSLRTLPAQRPFTPKDGHRQLFGESSARSGHEGRPLSTFSLHARNFEAPDSRPGSGIRLSPLDHKPRWPVNQDDEEPSGGGPGTLPKPPPDAPELRRGAAAGGRTRLLRAGSLSALPPLERPTEARESASPDPGPELREPSAGDGGPPRTDAAGEGSERAPAGPPRPAPRRADSESGTSCRLASVHSSSGPAEERATRTELGKGDRSSSQQQQQQSEELFWEAHIAPLIEELESTAAGGSEGSVDRLCDLCDRLHGNLAQRGMLGRRCRRRAGLLRTLFRLIDLNSAQLNLQLAKLCLALSVSGNNLLNICKLVFKISRSESNDVLFQNSSIIDSLLGVVLGEDAGVSGEAVVYCVGTLKFLSGNPALLRLLLAQDCVGAAARLIQRLRPPPSQPGHAPPPPMAGHILVQLTALLRNLADLSESRPLFVSHAVLSELCLVLSHYHGDLDICTNTSRIFSKLSSYSECCLALAQVPGCCRLFIELLSIHQRKQDVAVRLLFTLGNLTSRSSEAREQLHRAQQGAGEVLLGLYRAYQTPGDPPATDPRGPDPAGDGWREGEDVLVKLVRVLANMSVHPAMGPAMAADRRCVRLLLETLELRSVQESEELMVNVAATINNLSFYRGDGSVIRAQQLAIAKMMLKLLLSSSMGAVLEATRVYGNLSQSRDVRHFIMQNKVHQFVVTLLDSKNPDVCFSACGVLTNLALDLPSRTAIALQGATAKLTDCLRDFGPVDWQLGSLVCQTLWNLTEGGGAEGDRPITLDPQERETLLDLLSLYLDEEEALQWTSNEEMRDFHRACWEMEFLPVAQRLRSRIQSGAE